MLAVVVVAVLGASPAAPLRIASTGFNPVQVEPKIAEFYSEYFAQQLSTAAGVRIITQSELAAVLGLERRKQLLGCANEGTSCMAEIAAALNVDAVLTGSIAKVAGTWAVTVKVVSSNGELLSQASGQASDERILEFLRETAQKMAGTLGPKPVAGAVPEVAAQSAPIRAPLIPLIAGGAIAAAGALCFVGSETDSAALRSGSTDAAQVDATVARGKALQTAGWVMVGVGAAAAAAGAVWMILEPRDAVQPVVAFGPDGAAFGVRGALP